MLNLWVPKCPLTLPLIKLVVFLVSQRLHISRHYSRGPVWLPAPKAAAQSDGVHRPAAGGPGENFPEDSLPWCGDAWTSGHVHQPAWGPRSGKNKTLTVNLSCAVCMLHFKILGLKVKRSAYNSGSHMLNVSDLSIHPSTRSGSRTVGPSFARSSAVCRRSSFRSRRRHPELQRVLLRTPRLTSPTPTPQPWFPRPTLLPLLPPPHRVTQRQRGWQPRGLSLERWAWKSTSPPLSHRTASQQQRIMLTERRTKWEGRWGLRSGRRHRGRGERSRGAAPHPANGWVPHQVKIMPSNEFVTISCHICPIK